MIAVEVDAQRHSARTAVSPRKSDAHTLLTDTQDKDPETSPSMRLMAMCGRFLLLPLSIKLCY